VNALTDWVTATSTAITAILVGLSGWVAWLTYLRDKRRELPVIEPTFDWKEDATVGPYIKLRLWVVNRLDETLLIEAISVRCPRKSLLSEGITTRNQIGHSVTLPARGSTNSLVIKERIESAGSNMERLPGHRSRTDVSAIEFFIFPPSKWASGKISIILRISSKARTILNRRMVIVAKVAARPELKPVSKPSG
jgi:hypothetical protein